MKIVTKTKSYQDGECNYYIPDIFRTLLQTFPQRDILDKYLIGLDKLSAGFIHSLKDLLVFIVRIFW